MSWQFTISELIERFIKEMDASDRPLGESHRFCLRRLQRDTFAQKVAETLTRNDVIEYARERGKTVKPVTVGHDLTCLTSVLKYAGSDPLWGCEKVSAQAITAAKPFLQQ